MAKKKRKVSVSKNRSTAGSNKTFRQIMLTYSVLWIALTIIICVFLWKSLDKYQTSFDSAKDAANPDLAMEVEMYNLTQDNIKNIVNGSNLTIASRFESKETYEKFFYTFLDGKTMTFERDATRFSDARPVYDVYAGDKLFAVVSLKKTSEIDDYGFNKWKVGEIVLSENNYEYHDVYICISDGMSAYINGYAVGENEFVRGGDVSTEIMKKAAEITGQTFGYKVYYAGDMIDIPKLSVVDADGNDITENYVLKDNDLRDYQSLATDSFIASVEPRVKEFCEAYTYHIYRKRSADDVAAMMVDGSEAERLLWDAQSTLAWAWAPEKVEILSEEYTEYVHYNDEYFSVRSNFKIKKSDSTQEEIEDSSCQWLFKKIGDVWMVTYFTLQ